LFASCLLVRRNHVHVVTNLAALVLTFAVVAVKLVRGMVLSKSRCTSYQTCTCHVMCVKVSAITAKHWKYATKAKPSMKYWK
ncbi:excinuclease ABC subunit A, partial [Vibrio parahaemolyticus VPTS-2010_2]